MELRRERDGERGERSVVETLGDTERSPSERSRGDRCRGETERLRGVESVETVKSVED